MGIDDLLSEFYQAGHRFWFVQEAFIVERTDITITLHFQITRYLFVQAFLSERNQRLSLALVGPSGRLYGRDRKRERWHLHPFSFPQSHVETPEGMSSQPLIQFLAEVEEILLANNQL